MKTNSLLPQCIAAFFLIHTDEHYRGREFEILENYLSQELAAYNDSRQVIADKDKPEFQGLLRRMMPM